MKRPLLLIWLSAIYVLSGWSQDTIRLYLDSNFVGVEEGHAVIVRQAILNEGIYHITDQHVDGNMIFSGEYSSINPWIENGTFQYYDNSGKIYATGGYKNGFLTGTWVYFKEDQIDSINYDKAERMLKNNTKSDVKTRYTAVVTGEMIDFINTHLCIPPRTKDISKYEEVMIKMVIGKDKSISIEILDSKHPDFSYEAARVLLNIPDSILVTLSPKSSVANLIFNVTFIAPSTTVSPDEQALFQGGDIMRFREWVQRKLVYPPRSVENGEQGRVIVSFLVYQDGKVGEIEILKSSGYKSLDKEAVRVIGNSPLWEPAIKDKKTVNQQFVIPVIYVVM